MSNTSCFLNCKNYKKNNTLMKYSFNKYKYWITFLFLTFVSLTTPVSAVDYTISSVADWNKYAQQIASNNAAAVSANYTLEADLDFSDPATKFIPFGGLAVTAGQYSNMQGRMFKGKFDGKGHKLKGIHFGYATKQGLPFAVFGSSNGQIRNLIVEDMDLPESTASKSSSVGGGICGYFTDGGSAIIENCAVVNSSMCLSANCAGGIVGQLNGGTIRNCVVENFIIRNDDGAGTQRGGIVGYVSGKSIIENCYANVDFKSAQKQTGGIIGFIGGSNLCTVRICYATGHFKMMGGGNREAVGGLVGEARNLDIKNCGSSISIDILLLNAYAPQTTAGAFGKISSTISFDNIYATGQIEFSAPRKDPITGSKYDMAGINSFYGQANTGVTVNLPTTCYSVDEYYKYLVDGDYVRSEADIVYGKPATLKPLSFVQSGCLAQQMNNDLGLSNVSDIVWIQNKDCFAGFPVPFGNQAELLALLKKLELVTDQFGNALPKCGDVETTFHIKTVADFEKYAQMVADEAADWSADKTFIVDNDLEDAVTAGMGSESKPFLGTFNGGGHIINLSISGTTNVGLISVAGKTAKINNVQTKGSVTGSTNVGAVVGKALAGSAITGCANAAVVKGKTSVGGIVGNSAGTVSVSLNVATITGDEYVGGIAGTGFTLTNCANMGYICCEKTSTTGGIAGSASDVVSYCFNGGYTEGAAIANDATLMGCAYDDALSIKGQTGMIVEHFSATSLIPLTNWKSEAGLYPVPADLAATAIGKFATSVVYFSNKEKATAVCDSITANQTSWTNSSSVLKYNNKAYLPIAEGTTVLKYTDGGFTREIPIKVVAPGLFAGGFGNEFSPFIITKVAHLNQMATYVHQNNGAKGKVFELANDITDGVFDDVIGRSNLSAFYGTFRSSKGKLYNIPINNVSSSSSYALGLIGTNMGRIERISVTGILGCKGNGENATVGGIAGYSEGSIIECVSNVDITVSGYSYAGGICGRSIGAVLSCINIGNVTGESLTAGITCSKSTTSSLNVSNCYNGGVIKGRDVAGIVAMTGGSTSIKPVFENNINTGKVEGVKSDALVLVGGAAPLYKGGLFDAQHTLASSKVETAVADSTRKLVKESVVGWTSAANSYPQNLSYEVAKIASSPVFLNVLDSADNVKHDFSVATPTGVKWTSTTGCLSVQGDKVVRVKAGVDTLKATYGVYVRKVPVVVSCVWDTVVEPTVEYCNKYNGVTYTKDTELTVVDTTGTHDNADCGTVHIRTIKVKVGKQGQEMTYTGCGSYVYDGVEYKEDAVINNSSCDVITIKIYPAAKEKDSTVVLNYNESEFSYKASDGKEYKISRGNKVITDSLLVVDHIKSKTCDCDSIVRNVRVSIPTFQTEQVIDGVQCNTFTYKKLDGTSVELGWPFETRDLKERYEQAEVQNVVYRDTNFIADGKFDQIKVVTVKIYKSVFKEDKSHLGQECSEITIKRFNGTKYVLSGEKFLKDTVIYDSLPSVEYKGCPEGVVKYNVRLKGISEVKDTVFIGSHSATRCTDCVFPIVLEKVTGTEYADKGFCDAVSYKKKVADARPATAKSDATLTLTFEESAEKPCGVSIPYSIKVNKSEFINSTIAVCDSMLYTTKTNRSFKVKNDTVFSDTLAGVVPGCGCDSIWKVKISVFKPKFVDNPVTRCDVYNFEYLDKRGSLNITKDTVIVDTVKNVLGCDSVIRTTSVTIHPSFSVSETTPKTFVKCGSFTYVSPIKGEIVCKVDTTFNDSLMTQYGCDSIIKVTVQIEKPVVIDSVLHVCSDFTYTKRNGNTVIVRLGDNPAVVEEFLIEDVFENENPDLCDTIFNLKIYSHRSKIVKPNKPTPVCSFREYIRFDGTRFEITESTTVYDTLKSKVCNCDSIVRIDSFSVGKPYYPSARIAPDTTLFGCYLNTVLTYKRKSNAWNPDTTISYYHVASEVENQKNFLDIIRIKNPSVVSLDTVNERSPLTGRNVVHYYWNAHDTMRTIAGCDSVVPFRVEYDGKHFLGRTYFFVDHKYAPFTYDGITYEEPKYGVAIHDSVEVVLPSNTGGCDSTYHAMIRMYSCKKNPLKINACDSAVFTNLHNKRMVFYSDTVYSDTLRYNIREQGGDTARCDSVITTWTIKVGKNTPEELIAPIYIGGCDFVNFKPNGKTSGLLKEDTTFKKSTVYNCHYVNKTGCDSLVKVNVTVHKVKTTEEYVRRTDYYRYVSPRDGSISRISSDTTIEERVEDAVNVNIGNGQEITCDSVVITHISIRPAEWHDTTIVGCDSVYAIANTDSIRGEFENMPKKWYYTSTRFDMPNSVSTDIYYHVFVKVNKSSKRSVVVEGCNEVTYKGRVYKENADTIEYYTTATGCDSIDSVHIVVHPVEVVERTVSGCGYVSYKAELFTEDYTISDTIRYKEGCHCDSVITKTYIKIFRPEVVEEVLDSCMFFTYPKLAFTEFNMFVEDSIFKQTKSDSVYTESMSFYQYGTADENGCASIVHTTLNVNPCYPYPVIVNKYNWILALNKDLLYRDVHSGRITGYQWYKDGEMVVGANQTYYTEDKPLSGCYQVHVMYGDLEIESENICVDSAKYVSLAYDLYPDPVSTGERVSIKCNFDVVDVTADVYNALGVRVFSAVLNGKEGDTIEVPYSYTSAGNYYLKLTTQEGTVLGKKFIVK